MTPLLFDVNVLLALFDDCHASHLPVRDWLNARDFDRWATCPITENGFVRIISQPRYPNPIAIDEAITKLRGARAWRGHEFWSDAVSLLDPRVIEADQVGTRGRITDTYLLALAKHHGGVLVTLDQRISTAAVPDGARHLAIVA